MNGCGHLSYRCYKVNGLVLIGGLVEYASPLVVLHDLVGMVGTRLTSIVG